MTEEKFRFPETFNNLTEQQKSIIKIALSDKEVKNIINGKEFKIDSISVVSGGSTDEYGKSISWNLPGVKIYVGNEDWSSITEIIPLVDLEKKEVVSILKSYIKPTFFFNLSKDERDKAIQIVLSDPQIREKIDGKKYEIIDSVYYENWVIGKRVEPTQVFLHINDTGNYIVSVNLTENKVIRITESDVPFAYSPDN